MHDDPEVRAWFYPALAARQRDDEEGRAEFLRRLDTPGRVIIELCPGRLDHLRRRALESSLRGIPTTRPCASRPQSTGATGGADRAHDGRDVNEEELASLVGHRFPRGEYTIEHWENFLLTDCTARAPSPTGSSTRSPCSTCPSRGPARRSRSYSRSPEARRCPAR
ncbi:MAG: hypothetical protein R2705_04700 [Ilumatobacteraceae bacterium]